MRCFILLAALIAPGFVSSAVYAQPADDPFGAVDPADNPFGPADSGDDLFGPADPAADAFGAAEEPPPAAEVAPPRREDDAAPAAEPAPASQAALEDPAVQAVLESRSQKPYDLLQGIRILADLGHPELAQPIIEKLTNQQLDQEQKAALAANFSSGALMRLARNPVLGKQLGPFIDDLFQAAEAYRRDPGRLGDWARQLSDADENERALAIQALLRAGDAAVAPLVDVLADPRRTSEHARAKRLLVRLGQAAVPPLLGVLESPDAALKTQVAQVLGALRSNKAVAPLLGVYLSPQSTPALRNAAGAALQQISGHTPSPVEASRLLEYTAKRRLNQSRNEAGDGPPTIEVWHWNAEKNQSVPLFYDQTGATLAEAVRAAYDWYVVDPKSPQRRRLYLTTLLQAARLAAGLDQPMPTEPGTAYAIAAGFGPRVVEDVMVYAMNHDYIPAATAAAEILGQIGTIDLLAHGGSAPSGLARAANHADRRLRFAATAAIMHLDPRQPFAGSSHVTEGLGFFAGSYGTPRILIAHPLSAEGGKLAGLAAALGYDADVATNGREAYELAVQSPDYELVMIHSAINRPPADELLAQLRRDRRTADLPVGFIAPLNDLVRVEDFARRADRAEAFLQPQNDAEMKLFVGDLLARAGRSHVTTAERNAQAKAAMDWLVELAHSEQRVFDLRQLESTILPLIYLPQLAGRAIELLGEIGTDQGQQALLGLADSPTQPLAMRKAAVAALARSIRSHGILLTTNEIRRQYDIYNSNAGRNAETHEVLGAVLDTLENKGEPPPQS
ncbi:MAG: HEAT repeat domain-containing protein [Planctomycetota bacterium]|nr:MAG: HEAT repeat domain-containing protein [Planctomycetota bacterium]